MLKRLAPAALSSVLAILASPPRLAMGADGATLAPAPWIYVLSNKDAQETERWTITLDLDSLTPLERASGVPPRLPSPERLLVVSAIGNVFKSDGSPPSFVHCDRIGPVRDLSRPDEEFLFRCRGTDGCPGDPSVCAREHWRLIGEGETRVKGSFFLPPGGFGAATADRSAGGPAMPPMIAPSTGVANSRGATLSPDGRRYMTNKDVNGERWSISLNYVEKMSPEGLTVSELHSATGNVYEPDGSPPSFVYCVPLEDSTGRIDDSESEFHFRCWGTGPCATTAAECAETQWTLIGDRFVPAWFLLPPDYVATPHESDPDVTVISRAAEPPAIGSPDYNPAAAAASGLDETAGGTCNLGARCRITRIGSCEGVEGQERLFGTVCKCVVDHVDPQCILVGGGATGSCGGSCEYGVGTAGAKARGVGLPYTAGSSDCLCYAVPPGGEPPVQQCAGSLGTTCPAGRCCADDPRDGCSEAAGDPSCAGICVSADTCGGAATCGICMAPACGDGIQDPAEECDEEDLGGQTCASLGFAGGTLSCSQSSCTLASEACTGDPCGNGVRDPLEECDGSDMGAATCAFLGFSGGDLQCADGCTRDTTGCFNAAPRCGDGQVNQPTEECDDGNDDDRDACSNDCKRPGCGDGTAQGDEECDGDDLRDDTCESRGHSGGELSCTSDCLLDESACTADPCGPGGPGSIPDDEPCSASNCCESDICASHISAPDDRRCISFDPRLGYECTEADCDSQFDELACDVVLGSQRFCCAKDGAFCESDDDCCPGLGCDASNTCH